MQSRYHLNNKTHMVEFPHTEEGLKQAKEFRANHPEFKGRKIKEVIQVFPSRVEIGKVYKLTHE